MSASFGRSPVEGDLQAIRQELERSNPELYRQWALYLQVLREILPLSVDQVCFHLATQIYPARYSQLEAPQRQHFHTRLGELVKQCCSLLTVEQLISLAIRLGQDQGSQQQPRRSRGPNGPAPSTLPSDGAVLETTLSPPPAGSSDRDQPLSPRGSVALGLDLPIEPGWLGWGAASVSADQERGASPPEEPHDPSDPVDDDDDPGDPEHHLDRLRDGLPQALGDLLSDVLAEGADEIGRAHV